MPGVSGHTARVVPDRSADSLCGRGERRCSEDADSALTIGVEGCQPRPPCKRGYEHIWVAESATVMGIAGGFANLKTMVARADCSHRITVSAIASSSLSRMSQADRRCRFSPSLLPIQRCLPLRSLPASLAMSSHATFDAWPDSGERGAPYMLWVSWLPFIKLQPPATATACNPSRVLQDGRPIHPCRTGQYHDRNAATSPHGERGRHCATRRLQPGPLVDSLTQARVTLLIGMTEPALTVASVYIRLASGMSERGEGKR